MCMTFGCNPRIIFCHFFRSSDLGLKHLDTGYLMDANLFKSSLDLFETCRCFCQDLKLWMTFGCNPQINFVTFFAIRRL